MSAALSPPDSTDSTHQDGSPEAEPSTRPAGGRALVVRRNAGLAALVGAAASAVSIAYLWRATATGAPLDWTLCLVLAVVAAVYLTTLVDARTPLLVADELGVRLRFGHQWRGLPWEAVDRVLVSPRHGLVHDGRLLFTPHELAHAVDGLDARGRRAAAVNQRLYGAALAVPMSLTTRASTPRDRLADQLRALSGGRSDVVTDVTSEPVDVDAEPPTSGVAPEPDLTVAPGTSDTPGLDPDGPADRLETPSRRSVSLRGVRRVLHVPVRGVGQVGGGERLAAGSSALAPVESGHLHAPSLPEGAELRRTPDLGDRGDIDDGPTVTLTGPGAPSAGAQVHPIARLGDPVEPLVVEDFVTRPAYDPVIGPELAAARHRVGLSVDELADRTRIRPHVIESIEVDDFAPCGGDFYARGHLRTLARVLGREPQPLIELFNTRYATAPVNARKVFEAELATGMTGSVRGPAGGPSWALLVASVLVVALVWGVVRMFSAEPTEQLVSPVPALNGSAGVVGDRSTAAAPPATPVHASLVARHNGSSVVVRDGGGKVAWAGTLAPGGRHSLTLDPPVRVQAEDAGAVEVWLAGRDLGAVGTLGTAGRRVFHRPVGP